MFIKRFTYSIIAISTFLMSCIREDLTECVTDPTGVRLHYYYTRHTQSSGDEEVNLFGSDIHRMEIYIFDTQNLFYKDTLINDIDQLTNDNDIFLPLPEGKYTIVSWGGSSTLGSQNDSYEVIDATDPSDIASFLPYLTRGVTPLDHFRLMLKDDDPEDMSHVKSINTPANLYYGEYQEAEVVAGKVDFHRVSVIKNTNLIHVKIGGITHLPSVISSHSLINDTPPLGVFITARNGRYEYNNTIGGYARTVRYEQPHQMLDPDTMLVSFTVLRLMEDDTTSRVVLESPDLPGGQYSLDIVRTIIEADNNINGQDDLDINDEYNIDINLDINLSITIWINGWLYNTIYPGVKRE